MLLRHLGVVVLAAMASPVLAETPGRAFKPAGAGLYEFDTGVLRGTLKVDGKYQGIYPLVDVATGAELVHAPGVFSPYRVFTAGRRFGNAARDWPTTTRLLDDGAVEVCWAPAPEHPLQITAVYRLKAADTLDWEVAVTPQQAMPTFELFLSSYFTKGFRASIYRTPSGEGAKKACFVPIDRTPQSTGGYVMFPRDEPSLAIIQDGRWKIPPNAVDWAIERGLAAPVAIRRDAKSGLTAAMMAPPDACFALSFPWNAASAEAGGYRSLYVSLFGGDLQGGQTSRTRCRLVIAKDLSDDEVLRRYGEFVKESK